MQHKHKAGRESKSPSQRAPVEDTVKRGGGGGKVIQNKRRAKNDVEPRVHWTLNTEHQFIIIDHLHQDTYVHQGTIACDRHLACEVRA